LQLLLTIYTADTTYASPSPLTHLQHTKSLTSHILCFLIRISATSPDVSSPSPPPSAAAAAEPLRSQAQAPLSPPTPTPTSPSKTAAETAAAHLLASHATSFDPQTALSTLPPRWPLRTLQLYLVRTLRTAAHTAHERALVKALATGQNLAVTDAAHAQLRAAGALIEEAVDEDDEDGDMGVGGGGGRELVLDEKAVLASDAPASRVVDVPLRGKTERADADASTDAVGVVGSWMSGRSSVTNRSQMDYDCEDMPQ
jgi:hypothetical protein